LPPLFAIVLSPYVNSEGGHTRLEVWIVGCIHRCLRLAPVLPFSQTTRHVGSPMHSEVDLDIDHGANLYNFKMYKRRPFILPHRSNSSLHTIATSQICSFSRTTSTARVDSQRSKLYGFYGRVLRFYEPSLTCLKWMHQSLFVAMSTGSTTTL
jgi:hypothetical protein